MNKISYNSPILYHFSPGNDFGFGPPMLGMDILKLLLAILIVKFDKHSSREGIKEDIITKFGEFDVKLNIF